MSEGKATNEPLLKVPRQGSTILNIDLKLANIPKQGPGGVACFHCLRNFYINNILDAGATPKAAMDLARYQSPAMTMGIYAQSRLTRRAAIAEALGDTVAVPAENNATSMHALAAGDDTEGEIIDILEPSAPDGNERDVVVSHVPGGQIHFSGRLRGAMFIGPSDIRRSESA